MNSGKYMEEKESANQMKAAERKKLNKRILGVILVAAVLILILVLAGTRTGKEKFTVEKGWGTVAVAHGLKEQGIIRSETCFKAFATVAGAGGDWKYGTYTIDRSGYWSLVKKLTTAEPQGVKVTIPEGYQAKQIGSLLEKKGICTREAFLDACVDHTFDYHFLKGLPISSRISGLEGYLFPDTYYFPKNTDPDVVINAMLTRFDQKVNTAEIRKKAKARGLTLDQLVILSSMVESEATTTSDRKKVASVFLNRLKDPNTHLGRCVTVEYAMGVKKTIISYEDTQYDSPYNTYLNPGLPYGPICCPGMDSINAVLDHKDTDYYYFQSDKYGKLHFASTYEEHLAIQKELQANWKTEEAKTI